ncbi:eukaryotic initiation factor [Dunaliella salina]|uniref:eIF-4F 25 kDa subunit n=1 Tax=Dunaliella salina TaxID=3046 RepID=A0ABQ7GTX8_DUNSA|nr:eukaryotic initiation factor [Dunaliella salina]|eukprot:KAF5838073.1 eukaryotic initiation factor [Dunaliella salina]
MAEAPAAQETSTTPNFDQKHPLENAWTLWFDNPQQKQTTSKFGQTLRPVFTFNTVEEFWCLYNNIKTPGQLQPSATFYLFKDGIEPKWEDPRNFNGGSWTANVPNRSKPLLDAWWLNSVLACIGEQFTEGEEICGVAVNVRAKGDRIELWTKTAANEAKQTIVGRELKKFLDMSEATKIGYQVFQEVLNSKTKAKDRYGV